MSLKIGRRTAAQMRKSRPSQSTGKSKGIVATAIQKTMCRRNRSYKYPKYAEVMASLGSKKRG